MIKTYLDINSNDNSLFVTTQCNNRCLMCSQPPLNTNDIDELLERNFAILDSAPVELRDIGITGGEPTLLGKKLFVLIERIKDKLPDSQIHLLSNGRGFAKREFAKEIAQIAENKILIGIPLHSDFSRDHDLITQVEGSFIETMKGLYNLAEFGVQIELRIVINKINFSRLYPLSNFIYKNLPFVSYISFMGLEDTGYAVKNFDRVWIDPSNFQIQLEKAVLNLATWGMNVSVFNLPHCCLPESLYEFARKSISDWKVKYLSGCENCTMKAECCGLFATSKNKLKVNPIRKWRVKTVNAGQS
jgi:His-Xaa-Ser system radical SAM maturase HxsC